MVLLASDKSDSDYNTTNNSLNQSEANLNQHPTLSFEDKGHNYHKCGQKQEG